MSCKITENAPYGSCFLPSVSLHDPVANSYSPTRHNSSVGQCEFSITVWNSLENTIRDSQTGPDLGGGGPGAQLTWGH